VAQEDGRLPARPGALGSVMRVVEEITRRVGRRAPLVVASTRHPGDAACERVDGVEHVRVAAGLDRDALAAWYRTRNRLARRLGARERHLVASPLYYAGWIRRVARALAAARPSLVHLHNVSQFLPPLRRAMPDAALVLQMHCDWLVELPPEAAARRLAAADLVLGVSHHVVDAVAAAFPAVAPRCRVLHNGVALEAFPPRMRVLAERRGEVDALRARHRLGSLVVLYVGRLSSEKGVHVLLAAFDRLRARHPDASCVVVGPDWGPIRKVRPPAGDPLADEIARLDRDYMGRLRALAAPHGDRVVFAGAVPNAELPVWHAAADVLAAPSLSEAFGIPPVEAGASELPVVASAVGGLRDTVAAERTGLVVPPADPAALAEALERLAASPALARALGEAGRRRVAAEFTWDAVAERLMGYYEALLARRGARA
jgi:glycosyltransferase involved in cell wall biosynthesis